MADRRYFEKPEKSPYLDNGCYFNKSSAVAEMGDRGSIDMG